MASVAIIAVAGLSAWGATAIGVSAAVGWAAGAMVGAMLFGQGGGGEDEFGPKLENLKVSSSARGANITRVYGTSRIAGNIIWSRGLRETTHVDEVGKGGSNTTEVTWYTYSCTFAIALCEGEISGVRKIWADGKLIFDVGETASATQVLVSNQSGVTIYNGTEDQLPSSLAQTTLGIDNTPAMRGLAYLAFDDMQLEEYGNRIPNITAEVVGLGSEDWSFQELDSPAKYNGAYSAMHHWDGITSYWVEAPYEDASHNLINITEYHTQPDSIAIASSRFSLVSAHTGSTQWPVYQGNSNKNKYLIEQYYYTESPLTKHRALSLVSWGEGSTSPLNEISAVASENSSLPQLGEWPNYNEYQIHWANWNELFVVASPDKPTTKKPLVKYKTNTSAQGEFFDTGIDLSSDQDYPPTSFGITCIRLSESFLFIMPSSNSGSEILKYDKKTFILIDKWYNPASRSYFSISNNDDILLVQGNLILVYENFSTTITKTISTPGLPTGVIGSSSPIYKHNIFMSDDHDSYAFWYSYWNHNPDMSMGYKDLASNQITLASTITKICLKCGLESSDIDVSSLTSEVTGMVIHDRETPAASLRALLATYNVAVYEKDWKIVFVEKGVESPEFVDPIDLGATHQSDMDLLLINRVQSTELPRRINVQYSSQTTDYQIAVQRAQRVITDV